MEVNEAVHINCGRFKGEIGIIKEIKEQNPYDMLTVRIENGWDLTLFTDEVFVLGETKGD